MYLVRAVHSIKANHNSNGFLKDKLQMEKRNSKSRKSKNNFPDFEQVITSTQNLEIELEIVSFWRKEISQSKIEQ